MYNEAAKGAAWRENKIKENNSDQLNDSGYSNRLKRQIKYLYEEKVKELKRQGIKPKAEYIAKHPKDEENGAYTKHTQKTRRWRSWKERSTRMRKARC